MKTFLIVIGFATWMALNAVNAVFEQAETIRKEHAVKLEQGE